MDRDFWESFINLYKLYPCIWNSKSPDYNNKNLRDKAYSDLVDFCKTRYPSANKDYVVKKIHSFRCSFRRELRKVLDSQKSGASLEDIYTPHLWYYDLLYFITEGAVDLESNDDIESYTEDDYLGANVTTVLEDSHDSIPQAHCDSGRSSILNSISRRNPKKRKIGEKKVTGDFNELMGVTTTKLRNSCLRQDDDDFDITGKKVAADLRTIDTRQRVFVEKLIADAMYYGKLGKLNESSQIQLK